MKVGILTFHRALNYGALLQAFALRQVILSLGVNADIIDYRNDMMEKLYEYPSFSKQLGLKNKLRYLLYSKTEKQKRKRFENFRTNDLGIKQGVSYNRDTILQTNGQYDLFFTGSDQVWSPDAHKLDGTFFLNFVEDSNKKKSYAASFGVAQIQDVYKPLYQKWLNAFSICSVREEQGKSIIEAISDVPVRIDVDPVLLLHRDEWISKLNIKKTSERYAFIYSFGLSHNQKRMAEECYRAGMKIYIVGTSLRNPLDVPCEFLGDLGPKEFVHILSNASFVITNSFHGTAFSIVFNVPFAVEYLSGSAKKANSRIENIVQKTRTNSCLLSSESSTKKLLENKIAWNDVNNYVDRMRKESLDYIRRSMI